MVVVRFTRLKKEIETELPTFAYQGDACADLRSAEDAVLEAGQWKAIGTNLIAEIPRGYEIQVRPRSGLALKHGVTVLNSPGTIDADYRGEIRVILINHGSKAFEIKKGDRIAQIGVKKVEDVKFEWVDNISETERGEGGFGSTGLH
ncbi:MAG: dUTP diphosphatase [Methanobacteriota archaeon]|nr:MAG: dUTP diphosphatase [Euryarchaeota archaeon]